MTIVAAVVEPLDTEFDPWTRLGITCGGYGHDQDVAAIYVLMGINMRMGAAAIAEAFELDPVLVEL